MKIKNIIIYFVSVFLDYVFVFISGLIYTPKNEKSILIIKPDAIGDYILFRNFIECIKKSKKYNGYKIYFLGNNLVQEMVEIFDKNNIDHFWGINLIKFQKNFIYKYKMVSKIRKVEFEVVFCPVSSRLILLTDRLVFLSAAKKKVAYENDNYEDYFGFSFTLTNTYYDEIIPSPNADIFFEFDRNKYFVEKFIDEKIEVDKTEIKLDKIQIVSTESIIIFPGAGKVNRMWPQENFSKLISKILEITDDKQAILLCGSEKEKVYSEKICSKINSKRVVDLTGKLKLTELFSKMKNCEFIISNESAPVHIGVALGKNVVCISRGSHYGRFHPYPDYFHNRPVYVYPDEMDSDIFGNKIEMNYKTEFETEYKIESISVDKVYSNVQKLLKGKMLTEA